MGKTEGLPAAEDVPVTLTAPNLAGPEKLL